MSTDDVVTGFLTPSETAHTAPYVKDREREIEWHLPVSAAVSPWRREVTVGTGFDDPRYSQITVIEVSPSMFAVAHCTPPPASGQVAWGCAYCGGFHPVTMPMCPSDPRNAVTKNESAGANTAPESVPIGPGTTP